MSAREDFRAALSDAKFGGDWVVRVVTRAGYVVTGHVSALGAFTVELVTDAPGYANTQIVDLAEVVVVVEVPSASLFSRQRPETRDRRPPPA